MRCLLLLMACWSAGCVAYEADCVIEPSATIAAFAEPLDVRSSTLRTQEAAVGDLIADAFYEAMLANSDPAGAGVDLALVHAGAISDRNDCGHVAAIGPGEVSFEQITSLLPDGDDIELVRVDGRNLLRALEHAVAFLGEGGPWGLSPRFLQVSHLRFAIDCAGPPAVGDLFAGGRIAPGSVEVLRPGGYEALALDEIYEVAVTSLLAGGGEDFRWLAQPVPLSDTPRDVVALSEHIIDLANAAGSVPLAPTVDGRIVLDDSCAGSGAL